MSDNLTDRIAEVVLPLLPLPEPNVLHGQTPEGFCRRLADGVAHAVVKELGLKPADKLTPEDGIFYVTKVYKDD
jgi:hypothetical protein